MNWIGHHSGKIGVVALSLFCLLFFVGVVVSCKKKPQDMAREVGQSHNVGYFKDPKSKQCFAVVSYKKRMGVAWVPCKAVANYLSGAVEEKDDD